MMINNWKSAKPNRTLAYKSIDGPNDGELVLLELEYDRYGLGRLDRKSGWVDQDGACFRSPLRWCRLPEVVSNGQ